MLYQTSNLRNTNTFSVFVFLKFQEALTSRPVVEG